MGSASDSDRLGPEGLCLADTWAKPAFGLQPPGYVSQEPEKQNCRTPLLQLTVLKTFVIVTDRGMISYERRQGNS